MIRCWRRKLRACIRGGCGEG